MTGPVALDRASDREKVGVFLGLYVATLVILVAFPLCLPPARTAEAQGTPAQVMGVSASADDHDSITASWVAVTSPCGSQTLYYEVRWDDDSGFASPQDNTNLSDTTYSYRITGLQEDTPYFVQVRGVCVDSSDDYTAKGEWSAAASATTDLQPPKQVPSVMVNAVSDVEIMVAWRLAVRAGGYQVQWREDGQAFDASRQEAVQTLAYDVTGLTAETQYYVRVIATRTGASDAAPSAEATATTKVAPTPAQVTGVAVTTISDRELQVTWTAAAHATGYVVQWDTDGAFPGPDESKAAGTGVIIERLRAETEYHVRVRGARANASAGAYSTSASATTGDAQTRVWAERFPGGAIAAQLSLSVFAGVMAGVGFKSMSSPRREAVITGAMSLGALILPAFGLANEFWVIGVALLVLLSSIAAIFIARR